MALSYGQAQVIPGADFLDIQGEFSDQDTKLRFMMAGPAELEVAFRRHGVSNDSRVVLYSLASPMWATRFWWMLESLGFSRASVLDGGFEKWSAEGRAIERGSPGRYLSGDFTATSRPGFFVDKHTVMAARNDPSVVVIIQTTSSLLERSRHCHFASAYLGLL